MFLSIFRIIFTFKKKFIGRSVIQYLQIIVLFYSQTQTLSGTVKLAKIPSS